MINGNNKNQINNGVSNINFNNNMNINTNMNNNMNMNMNNSNNNNNNNMNFNNNISNLNNFNNNNINNSNNNYNFNNNKINNFNDQKDKKDPFIERLYRILNCEFLVFNLSYNYFKQDKIINYSEIQIYYNELSDYINQNQFLSSNIEVLNLKLILIIIIFEKIFFFFHSNNLFKYNIPNMSNLVDDIEIIMEKRIDSNDMKYLCFFQNKLEFLYRYSKTFIFKNKSIPFDVLNDYNLIYNCKNLGDSVLKGYYNTIFLYLKNDMDMCNSEYLTQISNIDEIGNKNINLQIYNHYLRQKYIVINTRIERERKGYNLELQNLNSLLNPPVSNNIYNKVIQNLQDCYYYKNDIMNLNNSVNSCIDFLKQIGLSGDNINYQLESNILVNLKKLYLKSIKNETIKDLNLNMTFNDLNIIFKNFNDIFSAFKKNEYAKLPRNESLDTIKKYLTIYQLNYVFYCKFFDQQFNVYSGFITDLLKEDKNIFSNLKPEYFINLIIIKPNDQETNILFYNHFEQVVFQTISNSNNYRKFDRIHLFFLNNRLSMILNSLLSDNSSSKCKEYIKMIYELCKNTLLIFKRIRSDESDLVNSLFSIFDCQLYLNIFSNIFYYYAFSYYFMDNYKDSIKVLDELTEYISFFKFMKITSTPFFHSKIEKLKADILFKETKFNDSLDLYQKILKNEKEDFKTITLIYFNCGLINVNLINIPDAKLCFEQVKNNYDKISSKKGNIVEIFEESRQILDILNSL